MARKPMPSPEMTAPSTRDDARRRLRRFVLGGLAAAVLVAAMSGCAMFRGASTSTQLNTIGKVQITSTICAADIAADNPGYSPGDATCQASGTKGNANGDAGGGTFQISLAYKIPNGASGPASFTSANTTTSASNTPCGSGLVFNQNAGLATAIQNLTPAGSGKKWVAYYSTTQPYTTSGCQYITVSPQFTLNQGFGVVPFQGPFTYRPVVGWRQVNESQPGNTSSRAATCGTSITSIYNDGVDSNSDGTLDEQGICADDPTAATISGADLSQNTRDLGVIPQTNGTAHAGGSGSVTFTLSYKGAALPSGQFNLAASTNIAGATATPSVASINPGADTDTPVTVNVSVPANTTPGSYNVNLTATLSTDVTQTRGGAVPATLTVGNAFDFDPAPDLPDLPGVTLNGQAQTTTKKMNSFGVNDTTASPTGWNVTVVGDSTAGKSAVFKQYCTQTTCGSDPAGYVTGGRTLVANSLTLNSTGASWTGGTGSAPAFTCNSGCFVDHATATKIVSAASGQGTGLWSTSNFSNSSLSLGTPTTLRVLPANEQYHADLVWTLNSGP
jgi:putative surface cell wall-binding protein